MPAITRIALVVLSVSLMFGLPAAAQAPQQPPAGQQPYPQTAPQQQQPIVSQVAPIGVPQQAPGAAQPQAPFVPQGFQLNQLQSAFLDTVLTKWQDESGKVTTFKCDFERWEYNVAFGPSPNIPLNKDKGELTFQKPDKGSFQISEIKKWQAAPVPPGTQPPQPAQGDWVKQGDAIGEHWVCDGKSVFEYRHNQKQLVERPIPAELQGQAIMDGPLPFLFGAEAAKLKQRYWLRVDTAPKPDEIWLTALPKFQADAANFTKVEVVLDRQRLMPKFIQVHLPDGSRHMYIFDIANATVNGALAKLQSFFQRPRTPVGWKRVVDPIPVQQAAQPVQPPR